MHFQCLSSLEVALCYSFVSGKLDCVYYGSVLSHAEKERPCVFVKGFSIGNLCQKYSPRQQHRSVKNFYFVKCNIVL